MALSADTTITIKPSTGLSGMALGELWLYREVVLVLAWRTIKVKYKQTIFGASWAIMQPLITMLIFTVIFSRIAKIPTDGIPYPIFVFAGLLPWQFFSNSLSSGSDSLVGGGSILKQVYLPRFAMPLSAIASCLVDFMLAFCVMLALMAYYGYGLSMNLLFFPVLVLLTFIAALGVSLVLSAMNVQFRDVKHATPFLIQLWMYCTPVVYPISLIKDPFWAMLYSINPMVGIVEGFRWSILGHGSMPVAEICISAAVCSVVLVIGAIYFKKMERTFADVV
jgi:lipopolysaccharide transport system permease protein